MRYMVYATRTGAESRSRTEAQRRNCGPVTTHWWSVVEGVTADWACEVPEGEEQEIHMSASDRARLSTGWGRKIEVLE